MSSAKSYIENGRVQGGTDASRDRYCLLPSGNGEKNRELVAAEACHRVGITETAPEPVRHLQKEVISVLVPERAVDLFEPVEAQEQHRHGGARASSGAQGHTGPVLEQGPVRKVAQRVVQGLIPVVFTFKMNVPLVAGGEDCSADDQADRCEQRRNIDEEHKACSLAD